MKSTASKSRIIRESVKDRHTSHWDLDMLSRAELEAMMMGNKRVAENLSGDGKMTRDSVQD